MELAEWFVLRDVIDNAAQPGSRPPSDLAPHHPAVDLVRQYFATGQEAFLNEAAIIVATEKPGIDREFAQQNPWLVIDKA